MHVLAGTYFEAINTVLRGAPGQPITVVGEGGRPVLSGQRSLSTGLWLEGSENVVIRGFEVVDYRDIGINVMESRSVVLRDLVVHDNGFASRISWAEGYGLHVEESSGLTVEGNDVYNNGPDPRTPSVLGTGIDCFAIHDSVIRNNRSHDNIGGGILVEDSTNVLVEGNEVFGNDLDASIDEWWDGGLWVDGGRDITVRRNVFRDNRGPGIEISDEDFQSPTGYVLEDNVSIGNYFGILIWNFGTAGFPPNRILSLSGNDFSGNSRRDVWICPGDC